MSSAESSPGLRLDHASLRVADADAAVRRLEEKLGLAVTRTPGQKGRHNRLHLHRSYLEVSAAEPGELGPNQVGALPLFLLGTRDIPATAAALRERGIESEATLYRGVDGVWDELRLATPEGLTAPFIIHRVEPPELARDWPPPNPKPHLCGAFSLAAVCVAVPKLDAAVEFYRRVLGLERVGTSWTDAYLGSRRLDLPLPDARLTLLEPLPPGAARGRFTPPGPGPVAVMFGVETLERPEAFLTRRGLEPEWRHTPFGTELWLDPSASLGVPVGFVERPPPA